MKETRWVEPKWKNLKTGSRVRVRWPGNQWKYATVTKAQTRNVLAELDQKGVIKLEVLGSFEVQEEYEIGMYL